MGQNLTTLATVKSYIGVTGSTDDTMLTQFILSASNGILAYLDRKSLFKAAYPEYFNGNGGPRQMLRQWPVVAVNSLTINGLAQTASIPPAQGYFLDPYDGYPPGRMQFINMIQGCFPRGLQNVYVNYSAGYCVQNEDVVIPTTPYQYTALQFFGSWGQDDGVTKKSTGAAFTAVASNPTTGQYSVSSAGLYTFAAADAGVEVLINYSYIPAQIEEACYGMVAELYAYRQRTGLKSHTVGGQTTASFDTKILTDAIKMKLQPYKRMVPY